MATSLMQLCGLVALVYYHIPSTSAECQNSSEYNRTLFVPKNGTAAFVCNVTTGHEAQLNVNESYWWPVMDFMKLFGIHPQYVEPNSTIGVEVKGNSALNKTSIVCYCYDHNSEKQGPVHTFETTILIYDPPSPPTNLTVTRIVGTSVNISWGAPFTPSGVALWYHVMIADLSGTRILRTLYQTNTTNYETNCSQCEITVVAVNEAGESDPVMFNLTNVRPQTPSPSPSEEPISQTLTTPLVPPLLVCVIVAPVGGFVIVVLIVIAFVAAVRCRRTRRLKIPAPKIAGPTDFQRDSGDTPALSSAYQAPRV